MAMDTSLPFALRLPVFAAPMFLISGPALVLAACKAGIIGAFPTPNARPISELDAWMRQITEGLARARDEQAADTIGPWCANLVTHSSNTRLPEDLELIARYRPPVVVTALGSPKPAIAVVQAYGGKVIADVTSIALARKAVAAGADGLACVSSGAGGHTGSISPFAFVSAVREFFDGQLVVGGGISDGWGVAGAIAVSERRAEHELGRAEQIGEGRCNGRSHSDECRDASRFLEIFDGATDFRAELEAKRGVGATRCAAGEKRVEALRGCEQAALPCSVLLPFGALDLHTLSGGEVSVARRIRR